MTDDYILAVDVGTSGVRALAVSLRGVIVCQTWRAYGLYHPQPGFAEQDPDELLLRIRTVLLEVRQRCGKCPVGMVWSSAMHGLMAVDASGRPLTALITWADLRSGAYARELARAGEGEKIFQAGGTPIHPMTPLCKLMWLRMEAPGVFHSAYKFVSIKEYVLFQLTGVWEVDYSIASATALFHTRQLRWNEDALRLAGINAQKLSKPVPPTQISTVQTDWLGVEWRDIPLVQGASDGCLAQLESETVEPAALSITIGTSSAVREMLPAFQLSDTAPLFCYYLNAGQYVRGGASNNGTVAIDWYQKTFLSKPLTLNEFADQLTDCPAGADGLLFLPHVLGERAPNYNPYAKAVFFGMTSAHTQLCFQRAVAEGICFAVKSIVQQVSGGFQRPVCVSGGFTRSNTLVQLLSNVLQRTLHARDSPEASALGAAKIGFQSLGLKPSWPPAEATVFCPDVKTLAVYEQQFELYQALSRSVAPLFEPYS